MGKYLGSEEETVSGKRKKRLFSDYSLLPERASSCESHSSWELSSSKCFQIHRTRMITDIVRSLLLTQMQTGYLIGCSCLQAPQLPANKALQLHNLLPNPISNSTASQSRVPLSPTLNQKKATLHMEN